MCVQCLDFGYNLSCSLYVQIISLIALLRHLKRKEARMPYEEFSYKNINERLIDGTKGVITVKEGPVHYEARPMSSKGFIAFSNSNVDPSQAPQSPDEKIYKHPA